MGVMLQVRNLDERIHGELKRRAAEAGQSLSDYVTEILAQHVQYRTNAQIIADFHRRHPGLSERYAGSRAADAIREGREERDAQLDRVIREIEERRRGEQSSDPEDRGR